MLPPELWNPPREFSVLPLWFWNDELDEAELLRQIADFEAHGVYGFVIHPRVGLPRTIGWMGDRMLGFMRCAVAEAARRDMKVVLFDEGMYPSGSSSGQVVATDPAFACRGFSCRPCDGTAPPLLGDGENLVAIVPRADGSHVAIIDGPTQTGIRGLHYIGEGPAEDRPPAADLLNPRATSCFRRLVYEKMYAHLGEYFGRTIIGFFSDEPNVLGKYAPRHLRPGTSGFLSEVERLLGYDFTPHLPALWFDDEPDAARHRTNYRRAVAMRLRETFYLPLAQWCEAHGVALMGHPAHSMDIGLERNFHVSGQDLIGGHVTPYGDDALEGADSTQAKCGSSSMLHLGRRRNSNECFGHYGHGLTFEQMRWLTNWLLVRGVNWIIPHAFYYSVRGPRRDERPPDVGPHSAWWDDYKTYADYCRRVCWLNTDSEHVCDIAILAESDFLPWRAAKVCFEHQRDFNYLEMRDLWESATIDANGIRIAGMHYKMLIVDGIDDIPAAAQPALKVLRAAGRVIEWHENGAALMAALSAQIVPDLLVKPPQSALRYRHVRKEASDYYILSNEAPESITFTLATSTPGETSVLDLWRGTSHATAAGPRVTIGPNSTVVMKVSASQGQC